MVEVASVDSNPTKLPDVETLQSGKMDASIRCFDLLCNGKCELESNLKLNIESLDKIPNLLTKNANGDIVYRVPSPSCTIRAPKGHNVWIKVELQAITTGATDHMCLGIKKRSENDYFDVLYNTDDHKSRYVDVLETDVVELIPLISTTKLSEGYTAAVPSEITNVGNDTSEFDFSSVYRVLITLHDSQWINEKCNLSAVDNNGGWSNHVQLGVGPIYKAKNEQLLAMNRNNGSLFSSSDGTHWTNVGSVCNADEASQEWKPGPVYGNGIWCAVNFNTGEVRYSIDKAKTWVISQSTVSTHIYNVSFGNDMFMAVSNDGKVFTSIDADVWEQIAKINTNSVGIRILGYGDGKWICGDCFKNTLYQSKNGDKWNKFSGPTSSKKPHGGCYENGYFYTVGYEDGSIFRSTDGENWSLVASIDCLDHANITAFNQKLYLLSNEGDHCHIGLFRPDGTI